ncbi:Ankyrin Repeat [Seminavis robusta]|uniref:Ankyrin Repeat n=1 Tax=Seminavis robusta TaxID=568900 RepID=A0A9N8ES23_9STRA|nr:Ankyrin Repeat [Seminavis robusta]|eukprot:Sro1670_g290000.1 Ankyrin Repeat (1094) ;mRNA; r:19811-23154
MFRTTQISIALDNALRERFWSHDTTEKVKAMLMNEKDANLKSLRKKYEGTLLHMAVGYGAPVDMVEAILEKLPGTAKITTKKSKQTALHWGMDGYASTDAIRLVLNANPQAAKIKDSNGRLPLHLGMYRRAPLDAIKVVLEAYPQATKVQDNNGHTPLHSGVSVGFKQMKKSTRPWIQENIEYVVGQDPQAAEIKTKRGRTPLHILLENGAYTTTVMTVVNACPSSLDVKDSLGRTTLHAAIANGTPARVLAAIVENYPSKVVSVGTIPDKKTLAHLIMEKKESAGAVWAILNAYRQCSPDDSSQPPPYEKPDVNGQTPLHIGMIHGASPAAITAVLNAFPEAASIVDTFGQTPLALGVGFGASLEAIFPVLKAFPNAAKLVDSSGNTPLFVGISKKITCYIIEAILVVCPSSGTTRNTDGLSPLHHAIQQETPDVEVVSTILRCCPEAAKTTDLDGNTPLLSLFIKTYGTDVRAVSSPPLKQLKVMTQIWTMLCDVYPLAAELENYAGLSPISCLVTMSSMSAVRPTSPRAKGDPSQGINRSCTFLQLRALLKGLRDGRPLKKLCSLRCTDLLELFLALFGDTNAGQSTPDRLKLQTNHVANIDLNRERVRGWTLLEILADLDNEDSCSILLQIVEDQLGKLQEPNGTIHIKCQHRAAPIVFLSKEVVGEDTMRKVADRAKLSVGSNELRQWGQVYGRFLRKYQIDKRKEPKHISETCVVVFATESRLDENGRQQEHPVALKFLHNRDAFYREIDMRAVISKREVSVGDGEQGKLSSQACVVPILACYTSRPKSEMEDFYAIMTDSPSVESGVDFGELKTYEHLRLQCPAGQGGSEELQYLLVMECGAGLDLNDVISHQNIAGRDLSMVLAIGSGIAKCLQFLNEECRMVHGDVKARNFVSLGVGAGYAAIDLDNAASIAGGGVVGKKRTSSGYLPPEQAAIEGSRRRKANDNADLALPAVRAELEDLKMKVQAANDEQNFEEQLRLLHAHKELEGRLRQIETGDLPVKPVQASPQYDMWCFGALLFYLCTGVQLFNMDFREDVNDTDLAAIENWNKDALLSKLKQATCLEGSDQQTGNCPVKPKEVGAARS